MKICSRISLVLAVFAGCAPCFAPSCLAQSVSTTRIQATKYREFAAFRLSDGFAYADVVPQLGRVMSFHRVYEQNWLWNLSPAQIAADPNPWRGWRNWGGDKTWLAPQSHWSALAGREWPPDVAWGNPDDGEFQSHIEGARLRIIGPVSRHSGCQITREFELQGGELSIRQTVAKVRGDKIVASIWSVTGIERPDAVWALADPHSPYGNGLYRWPRAYAGQAAKRRGALIGIPISGEQSEKWGADSPVSALVAVRGKTAFLQRAARPAGEYPEGAVGAGFPVTVFDTGTRDPNGFVELELMSPLRLFQIGTRWTHTVRWSFHSLKTGDAAELEALLRS